MKNLLHTNTLCFIIVWGCIAQAALAQESGEDQPLLGRYLGAETAAEPRIVEFDRVELPAGPMGNDGPEKVIELEGKYTMHAWWGPEGDTELVIGRSYEQAFKENGFEILFSCTGNECGNLTGFLKNRTFRDMTSRDLRGKGIRDWASYAAPHNDRVRAYLAKLESSKGTVHVFFYISRYYNTSGKMRISQIIVESAPLEVRQIETVVRKADELWEGLEEDGRVVVPGIFFDTDSSVLRAESRAAVEQVAELMKNVPGMSVHIVGHTDNQGNFEYNLNLSAQRARAVLQALTNDYGIETERMIANGVAFLAPVASNHTEEGRAENRRVELVLGETERER